MKTKITVARSSDLAAGTVDIKYPAFVSAVPESPPRSDVESTASADRSRELQSRRFTTPFAYDHWGLNE